MSSAIPAMAPAMALALTANFGSVELWQAQFAALVSDGDDTGDGDGDGAPASLVFQPRDGTLLNQRGADGAVPLLARAHPATQPIDDFITHIDWAAVYERYQAAVHDASEPLAASAADVAGALLLDVRRAGVYEQAQTTIPGAQWRDPATVTTWAAGLPTDRPVLVYCVYGHEVGRGTAMRLRAAGIDARFLRGGIDEWAASGKPLAAKGGCT
jgi:superoxide dismutase, Fe-Mn family